VTDRHDYDVSHVISDVIRGRRHTAYVIVSSTLNMRWRRWDARKWTDWQMVRRTWHSVTDSGQTDTTQRDRQTALSEITRPEDDRLSPATHNKILFQNVLTSYSPVKTNEKILCVHNSSTFSPDLE